MTAKGSPLRRVSLLRSLMSLLKFELSQNVRIKSDVNTDITHKNKVWAGAACCVAFCVACTLTCVEPCGGTCGLKCDVA